MQDGRLSSNSLVATIGLSLYTVWTLFVSFWMLGFPDIPTGLEISAIERLGAFIGLPIGFALLGILGRKSTFNVFDRKVLTIVAAICAIVPSACAALAAIGWLPTGIVFICFMVGSAAGAFVLVSWLDVFSRFNLERLGLSIGSATAVGVVVFLLLYSMPWYAQEMAASVCIITSIGLVVYSSQIAPHNESRAPLESTQDRWKFTREIEPSLLVFGMIFSLSFFFLLSHESLWLLMGIGGIAVGALALIAADLSKHVFRVTSVQRVITVITVITCLIMPLESMLVKVILSIIMAASCSFLVIANSVFLIRKICSPRSVPVFRAIPKRLFIFAIGFAIGWLLATIVAMLPGSDLSYIRYIRLILAILLVIIVMAFFPVEKHHQDTATTTGGRRAFEEDSSTQASDSTFNADSDAACTDMDHSDMSPVQSVAESELPQPPKAVNPGMTETEVFDAKCVKISKLYQLSPREAEILPFLAKGRNNAYLQDKFVISPHTAKSHIYNIYRKLDIHSQQKLMDFVEEFPDDYDI